MAKQAQAAAPVLKNCKGVPYEVIGDTVVIHQEDGKVELPLELGKSAYSTVFLYISRKTAGRKKGLHRVGKFFYKVEGTLLTVIREDDSVVLTSEMSEQDLKYPRVAAMNALIDSIE